MNNLKAILVIFASLIITLSFASATNNCGLNALSDGTACHTSENLSLSSDQNVTRLITLPENKVIINARLNLSAWNNNSIKDGLFAYYPMNESFGTTKLVDAVAGIHNTSAIDIRAWGENQSTDSLLGNSGNFTGKNQNINLSVYSDFNPSNYDTFAINFWAKMMAGGLYYAVYMDDYDYNGIILSQTDIYFDWRCNTNNAVRVQYSYSVPLDTWLMYSLVSNGTDLVGYVNGTKVGSTACSGGSMDKTDHTFSLGYVNSPSPTSYILLDELGFWNRSLSSRDINLLYKNRKGYEAITTGNLYSSNLSVYIDKTTLGGSIDKIWNFKGLFYQSNNITTNFASSIPIQSSCVSGLCSVPVVFQSNDGGYITYSDLYMDSNGFLEINQTYNKATLVGSTETFALNFTYDSTTFVPVVTFIYNNTPYSASIVGSGSNVLAVSSITVPLTTGVYNFSWNITLNGVAYSSSIKNQSVQGISIDDCSTNKYAIYNFTIRDEPLRYALGGSTNNTVSNIEVLLKSVGSGNTILNYSHRYTSINPFAICLNTLLNQSNYRIDMTLDYLANGYVQKYYFLDNGRVTNQSINQTIDLHDLKSTDSTTFLFQFTDESGLKVPNGIVHVYRSYISDGVFREVERGKMDNNGETHLHLVEEDVIYYFTITLNGDDNVIFTSDNYNAKCLSTPCTISLSASGIVEPFPVTPSGADAGVNWNIIANATSRQVILTYTSNTSSTNMSIYLYKFGNSGNTLINSSSASGLSGIITLNVPYTYGNATYLVQVFNNDVYVRPVWIDWKESAQDYFGAVGAVMGGLIVLTIATIAVSEGIVLIIAVCATVVIIGLMQIVDLTWMAIISLICAGAIIVWRIWVKR